MKIENPFSTVRSQIKERRKFYHSICIDFATIAVGLNLTQTGPALLDLQLITNTNTEQASAFLTSASVGSVLGSLALGWFGRWNKQLTMCALLLGTAVSVIALPWCSNYILMIFMHGISAMFRAGFSTVATVDTIRIWAPNSRLWLQLYNLCFSIGGILSPLITKPFLAPKQTTNNTEFGTQTSGNSTGPPDTRLHYAYLIPGVWFAITILMFLVGYFWKEEENENRPVRNPNKPTESPLSRPVFVTTAIILCLMMFFCVSVQISMGAYLLTFGVTYLDWSKSAAANLTSIYWLCNAFSRLIALFYTNVVAPLKILIVTGMLVLVLLILMIFSSLYLFHTGVWICVGILGFCLSAQAPAVFMYTEEKIMKVTPKMGALLNLSRTIPGMVNPQIIGYLMQEVTPMWLLYLLTIHAIAYLVALVTAMLWAKFVLPQQQRGNTDEINIEK